MNARVSHHDYYFFCVLFLGLSAYMIFYESIIRFMIGARIFTLGIFFWWFILRTATGLIWAILLMRYLFYKKYKTAANTGIVTILVSFFLSVEIVLMLLKIRLMFLYIFTYYIVEICAIGFAFSLIFSSAGERRWLKMSGILGLILSFSVLGILVTESIYQYRYGHAIERISEWLTLASVLGPVFYIFNFTDELNNLKSSTEEPARLKVSYFLFIIGMLGISLAIFLSVILTMQSTPRL